MSTKKAWRRLMAFSFMMCGMLSVSYGQFSEGTRAAGGGFGFYTETKAPSSGLNYRQSGFQLDVNGGYFFKENLEAGMRLGFQSENHEQDSRLGLVRTGGSRFELGPYGRAYYTVTEVVGLFGEAGLLLGFGGNSEDVRIRTFEMGVRPGVILMVNENLGLEAKVGFFGYQRRAVGDSRDFNDTKEVQRIFRAGMNLSTVSFGFRLYLNE